MSIKIQYCDIKIIW